MARKTKNAVGAASPQFEDLLKTSQSQKDLPSPKAASPEKKTTESSIPVPAKPRTEESVSGVPVQGVVVEMESRSSSPRKETRKPFTGTLPVSTYQALRRFERSNLCMEVEDDLGMKISKSDYASVGVLLLQNMSDEEQKNLLKKWLPTFKG